MSGQQQGNGNGAPFRGQGNYQGQRQGNYGRPAAKTINAVYPLRLTGALNLKLPQPGKVLQLQRLRAPIDDLQPPTIAEARPAISRAVHWGPGRDERSNLAQPMIQQLQQPAFQQVQQPIIQQLPQIQQPPQIVHQPSVQSHPGLQCACCQQMGHISGVCPSRQR